MKTLYLCDLDGTLLRSDLTLSERTCRVIGRTVSRGIAFAFATARSRTTALKVTKGLTVPLPMIAYNGAFIVDTATGRILHKRTFTASQAEEICGCLQEFGLSPIVYRLAEGRERFSFYPGRVSRPTMDFILSRGDDPRRDPLTEEEDILAGEPFYFNCIAEEAALRGAYERLRDRYEVLYYDDIYSGERWLEIMPRGATKAEAALVLRDMLGCGRIAAFGDSVNDIALFETADEKYAVSNADPRLKALADEIIPSNDEDGVACKLEQLFSSEPAML
ncbi:MAG: HAD family phosphatase [Ruminococcus sp.]|nr:HAD family phosphatase [Ruminococcus sp.]